jgi:carbon storage regulator
VLILSRREGEAVMIGDDVTIVILGIKGHQVRVGISAPRSVNIYREEILSRFAPPEPNDGRAAQLAELRAPQQQSQVSGQAYRQQHPESAGLSNDETSNSHVRAIENTLGEH